MKQPVCIFWFRRDLRLDDNTGLNQALRSGLPVLPVFVFDTNILDGLGDKSDRRLTFIHRELKKINAALLSFGTSIKAMHDTPQNAFRQLLNSYDVRCVYANGDYEPYAVSRDADIGRLCQSRGAGFFLFKDQVIYEKGEVMKKDGTPYAVFTPYAANWKRRYSNDAPSPAAAPGTGAAFFKSTFPLIPLDALGFRKNESHLPSPQTAPGLLADYHKLRDFPALDRTTHAGMALRFGTISIRKLARNAAKTNEKFLDALIWREFFTQILWHFPEVASRPFRRKYENIRWAHDEAAFDRWCRGETGFPLVDAGMRQLNETGFMHNRVRMVAASFLTRILLVDWRWGEAWFADKLSDFELASNNGNWQWAAGCGCDAVPYFRIFNPSLQARRFDPENKYIARWAPEYLSGRHPAPMADYAAARQRALHEYKRALA